MKTLFYSLLLIGSFCFFTLKSKAQNMPMKYRFYNKITLNAEEAQQLEQLLGKLVFAQQNFQQMQICLNSKVNGVLFKSRHQRFRLSLEEIASIIAFFQNTEEL
ncbi:MAG: hypothetical protein EAZ55_06010 [Cytophagales bacterium]|nr:MAG: hypothetical protein EAZ55_06010 [Cytophagales bacterium]